MLTKQPCHLAGLSLLVHDETPYFRYVIRSFLSDESLKSVEVSEDFSALPARLCGLRPNILILSWEPEQKERRRLMQQIRDGHRGIDRDLRVLAITSSAEKNFVRMLAACDVNGMILKPYNAKTLLKHVNRMAMQHHAMRTQSQLDANLEMPRAITGRR